MSGIGPVYILVVETEDYLGSSFMKNDVTSHRIVQAEHEVVLYESALTQGCLEKRAFHVEKECESD